VLLHYKQYGESGKPLFILHGIFGMLDNWHLVAKSLSSEFTVYTIDARNHGQSPHSAEMSYQLMAEDVIELADHLGIESFILVGHSMGGKTAMWTAHQFPERIEKLILVDIAPKTYKPGHLQYFKAFEEIQWSTLNSRKEVDEALVPYEDDPGVRLFLAKNIDRNDAGGFSVKSNMKALKDAYPEIIGKLDFLNIYQGPTLFILGEKSHYLKEEDKPYIERFFPKAEYVDVAGAGHWVHADNMSGFLEKLKDFLSKGT
jgi:esterase